MRYLARWRSLGMLGWLAFAPAFAASPSGAADTPKGKTVDVAMSKTLDTAGPYAAGQTISYSLVVSNSSFISAANVQVTDTPTNLTIATVSGGGCTMLPCTLPLVQVGNNVMITVTATIDAAGAFDNSATATANFDSDPSNNTDSAGNGGVALGSADTAVAKALVTDGPYTAGQSVTYSIEVSNAGPSTATNVLVTDTPTNLLVTSVSGGGCTMLPCTLPSLASGASATIMLAATIPEAGAFDNSATVASAEFDPDSSNNFDATANGGMAGAVAADVSLTKTLTTPGPYIVGQPIGYTLVVGNAGPSAATTVQVTDTPTNLAITGVSGGGCTALPCTIASLASGANATITVSATITAAGAFDNSATATATEFDPNAANNTDSAGNNGTAGASADVSLVKTLTTQGPYTAGQSVSYALVVANAGPSTATAIQVTDTPTNLTVGGVSGGGCTALPCTIASLASGANATINVTATIPAAGAFDNSATATATETDPNTANNTDNAGNGATAIATANIAITKTAPTPTPTVGQTFTYTLAVSNAGPSSATGVVVTDPLPAGYALTSATPSQGSCSGTTTVTCSVGTLANAASATITLQGTITATGTLSNTATAAANEADGTPGNNAATFVAVAGAVAVPVVVPALDPRGLLAIIAGLSIAGAFAVRMRR